MSKRAFLIWVVLSGMVAAVIALFLLSIAAMYFFPKQTAPEFEIEIGGILIWIGVYVSAIGLGILESFWVWKKYKE